MYRIVNYKKIRTGLHRMLVITLLGSLSAFAWAQESVLKGRVVDVEGNPIVGAVVNVLEGSRVALTDKDGYFSLKKVAPADEIYASCVGYLPATAIAAFDGNFMMVLKDDLDVYAHTAPVPFGRKPVKARNFRNIRSQFCRMRLLLHSPELKRMKRTQSRDGVKHCFIFAVFVL